MFLFVVSFSYKKKDGDLLLAQARIKELEGQFNQSEAALNTALSENSALSAELADLKARLAKVGRSAFVKEIDFCLNSTQTMAIYRFRLSISCLHCLHILAH